MSTKLKEAELFAKDKYRNQKYGNEPYHTHLEAVVTRLKGIGITDEDVLCVAWLHDTIEDTCTTFAFTKSGSQYTTGPPHFLQILSVAESEIMWYTIQHTGQAYWTSIITWHGHFNISYSYAWW